MRKTYLTPTFIKTLGLVLVFVLLASILIIVDNAKVIKIDKYFDSDITVTYSSAESEENELVAVTKQLKELKGKDLQSEKYHSVTMTCKEAFGFNKLNLNLSSSVEQTVDIKIYINGESIDDGTALLIKSNKTTYYTFKQKVKLDPTDTVKIEFVSDNAISVSSFGLRK